MYPPGCYSPAKGGTVADWSTLLRDLRDREGLTRREVASRAAIAPATVKAYELGLRHPSRELLAAVLDALKADLLTRNQVLAGAGFVPDGRTHADRLDNEWFTFEKAAAEIEQSPFPAHLGSETMDVVAANTAMQGVWGVDLRFDHRRPFELNLLSMLSAADVADRIENWDEATSIAVSVLKGHYGGDAAIQVEHNPYLAAAMQHFLEGEPAYVQRLLQIWAAVEPRKRKRRWAYPVTWLHPEAGRLSFHVQVNPADAVGSISFNDWIPIDEATWAGVRWLSANGSRGVRTYVARERHDAYLALAQ